MPAEITPVAGASYPQLLRTPGFAAWRSVLGVLLGIALFLVSLSLVAQVVATLAWLVTRPGIGLTPYLQQAQAFERASGMLGAHLGLAALVPISFLLMAMIHRVRPRWLGSVQPGLRRRYLLWSLAVAAVTFTLVLLVGALLGTPLHLHPQHSFWQFLVVIVLTSPLQAAGEEYFFRGYLMQALGSLAPTPWVGVVLSSAVFAVFHGSQNLPLFLDRFAFGLLAATLVLLTGGIEAGIAAHVVNNVWAFTFAGLTSTIAASRALTQIGWTEAVVEVGGFALFAVCAWLLARRMRLRTVVADPA